MTVGHHRRTAGFTLIELIVVICTVALLVGVALDRLWDLQEAAEEAAAERNLAGLKAAVMVRAGELAAANRWPELQNLPASNPFALLDEAPADYAGETETPPPGSWSYSPRERAVIYRPRRSDGFEGEGEKKEMRFRLLGFDVAGQPRQGPGTAYVKLQSEGRYRWRDRIIR